MHILYATDGSESSLLGSAFLAALPLTPESDIRLLSVPQEGESPDSVSPALHAASATLELSPAQVTCCIREGHAAEQILHEAEAAPTNLIVVGVEGRSAIARFFMGSVSEWVARHARCSVLVARPLTGPLNKVVVGIDGSSGSAAVVEFLKAFPLPANCEIHLVAVVFPNAAVESARHMLLPDLADEVWELSKKERDDAASSLTEAAAQLRNAGCTVTTAVRSGSAAIQLLDAVQESAADLVVVGARGISNIDRFLLGSVSERVMRHAHCSVLVVK